MTPPLFAIVVTPDLVQSWRPCAQYSPARLQELMPQGYLTLPEVAALPIPLMDRVWALVRCMAAEARIAFAARVARDALPVWEARHPEDARPRRAVEAAEAYARDPTPANARDAAAARADARTAAANVDTARTAAAANATAVAADATYAAADAYAVAIEAIYATADDAVYTGARAERLERYVAWALEAATARPHPTTLAAEAPA